MSKDQWINQVKDIAENFDGGELDLDSAAQELADLGMDEADVRMTLDPDGRLNIPKGFFKGLF